MKSIKKEYESRKPDEEDFLYAWIDTYKIIRDQYDEDVYGLWGLVINAPDELEGFKKMKAFTYMEAILFCSIIVLNVYRDRKPNEFKIVNERFLKKLQDAVELHFLDTSIDYEYYIENRFQFYFHQIKLLQQGELPSKIYSAFYDKDFYYSSENIPADPRTGKLKKFNVYLSKMFNEANRGSVNMCK